MSYEAVQTYFKNGVLADHNTIYQQTGVGAAAQMVAKLQVSLIPPAMTVEALSQWVTTDTRDAVTIRYNT